MRNSEDGKTRVKIHSRFVLKNLRICRASKNLSDRLGCILSMKRKCDAIVPSHVLQGDNELAHTTEKVISRYV